MDRYKETFETWNNIAKLYEDKFKDLNLYNHTYDYICKAINKKNAKLLELGCGPGNITKYLLSKRRDFDILGIDIAPNMIKLAKNNNPAANFAVMDSRQINSLNNKYDGIIAGFCLPYLSPAECDELITNAYHILNDNGIIYLSFVEGNHNQSDFKTGIGGRIYFYYHDLNNLKSQLLYKGFDRIEIFTVNYKTAETKFELHTIVIARKKNDL